MSNQHTNGHVTANNGHTTNGHANNSHASAAASAPPAAAPRNPTGRPRILDDTMRREVRALVTAGCDLRYAAKYVGCSITTLRRELDRDPEFMKQTRRAEATASIHPLTAMNQAASTHWRAAAWMLERMMPERFGRRQEKKFGKREAKHLIADLVELLRAEVMPPAIRERLERRITALVEFATDTTAHPERSAKRLHDVMTAAKDCFPGGAPIPDDFIPPTPPSIESISDGSYWEGCKLWKAAMATAREASPQDAASKTAPMPSNRDGTDTSRQPAPQSITHDREVSVCGAQKAKGASIRTGSSIPLVAPRPRHISECAGPSATHTSETCRDFPSEVATAPNDLTPSPAGKEPDRPSPQPTPENRAPATPSAPRHESSKVPPPIDLFDESVAEFPEEYRDCDMDEPETFERKNAHAMCAQNAR